MSASKQRQWRETGLWEDLFSSVIFLEMLDLFLQLGSGDKGN